MRPHPVKPGRGSVVLQSMLPISLILLAMLTWAPLAGAQAPSAGPPLAALRDSLAGVTDSASLARRERALLVLVRGNRGRVVDHLELGFLALRLSELGRRDGADEAAGEFGWVTRTEPGWASGWYGLGLAELAALAGQGNGVLAAATLAPAARAFARAVREDPRVADRLAEEAERARRLGQRDRGRALLEGLRRAATHPARPPEVLAAQARAERDLGDPAAALAAFEAWLAVAGRLEGLALLEVARTRFLLGRADGAEPYYDGASVDLPVVVAQYREDLALIATPRELGVFDRATGGARQAFLRRFWGQRDRASLRSDHARLMEHYRRLYLARRLYPRAQPGPTLLLAPGASLTDHGLDDRGLVLVRHGEPDEQVALSGGEVVGESWRYRREEGNLALDFEAKDGSAAFQLLEPLPSVVRRGPDAFAPPSAPGVRPVGSGAGAAGLRAMSRPSAAGVPGADRTSYVVATTTDDHRPRFARALGARVDAVLFEAHGSSHALHLALAVPFDSLRAAWLGPGHEYPLRLRLGVFGEDGAGVLAIDSLVRPVTTAVDGLQRLAGVVSMALPPGRWRYRLELSDGDSLGTVFPVRALEAEQGGGRTRLSDLALGEADAPWQQVVSADRRVIRFLPGNGVERGRRMEVAYAVRAAPGGALAVAVTVARIDQEPHVALGWRRTITPAAPETVVTEALDTSRLRPGSYRVEVTVRDAQGGVARRWREFDVRPEGGGR